MVTTLTTSRPAATLAPPHGPGRVARVGRLAFGVMFTGGAAIHVAIVVTGTETYRHFADTAFIPLVKQVWLSVFMAHAALLGLLLAAFELLIRHRIQPQHLDPGQAPWPTSPVKPSS
jgi:hypothetical protein